MITRVIYELGHCLMGFLSGGAVTYLPRLFGIAGQSRNAVYTWESRVFGGVVEMWADPLRYRIRNKGYQPVNPYVFANFGSGTLGRRVSRKYIKDFIGGKDGMLS